MTRLEQLLGHAVPDTTENRIAYVLRSQCGEVGNELATLLRQEAQGSEPEEPVNAGANDTPNS
jgi:hypothetical protein